MRLKRRTKSRYFTKLRRAGGEKSPRAQTSLGQGFEVQGRRLECTENQTQGGEVEHAGYFILYSKCLFARRNLAGQNDQRSTGNTQKGGNKSREDLARG